MFNNLKVDVIGEVIDGFLEGGDFYIAREDLRMIGFGLRADIKGCNYLMKKYLLGTRYIAFCNKIFLLNDKQNKNSNNIKKVIDSDKNTKEKNNIYKGINMQYNLYSQI